MASTLGSIPGLELGGRAKCPSCHTQDLTMTDLAVSAGADWRCSRCGSRWDALRLATVAGYARWVSARADASSPSSS
jgi:hypothetical protein